MSRVSRMTPRTITRLRAAPDGDAAFGPASSSSPYVFSTFVMWSCSVATDHAHVRVQLAHRAGSRSLCSGWVGQAATGEAKTLHLNVADPSSWYVKNRVTAYLHTDESVHKFQLRRREPTN